MPSYQMKSHSATAAAPKAEPKPDIDPRTGKPDWSRYNATVVGNRPATNVRSCHNAHPAGLQCADCTPGYVEPVYMPVSFAASREYKDDEDGWQTVSYKKKGRKPRQWRDVDA